MRQQDLLSLSRPLLGALILSELVESSSSPYVLICVAAASATDMIDGVIARRNGQQRGVGRYIDNLCDAAFLALAFAGFAIADTWSHPLIGSVVKYSAHANWLPLLALAASFGSYVLIWIASWRLGRPIASSPQGHFAGVANYALAFLGGVAVMPGVFLSPWLLEPSFVTVALLNVFAGAENLALLVGAVVRGPGR